MDPAGRSQSGSGRGVYGFEIAGLDDSLLLPAEPGWPRLQVVREGVDADRPPEKAGTVRLGERTAEIWLYDGDRIELDRASLAVRFATREPLADQVILHPYLGLPAAYASYWLGRVALHGGAFLHAGRAWGLLGHKEGGKSSTLAWLLARGYEILSDDILAVEGRTVFAGPRYIDLRDEAAAVLGGEDLGVVGARARWRLRPGEVPPASPLGGIVHLAWGDSVAIEPLDPPERLAALVEQSVVYPGATESVAYLELAAVPTWRFVRPHGLDAIDAANAQLLDALSQAA